MDFSFDSLTVILVSLYVATFCSFAIQKNQLVI